MDIKTLAYFEVTCRKQSYAAAARELGMTPQGLMGALQRLATEVGEPLLLCQHNIVSPTPYGELLLDTSRDVLSRMNSFQKSLALMRAHHNGVIRIGCVVGSLGVLGEDFFDGFSANEPQTQTLVESEIEEQTLYNRIESGELDYGVLFHPPTSDLLGFKVASASSYLWVHTKDPLAKKRSLGYTDLHGRTLIAYDYTNEGVRPLILDIDASGVQVKLEFVGEMIRVLERVIQTRQLGLTSRLHVDALHVENVIGIPFTDLSFDYYLCFHRNRPLSSIDHKFLDYIHSCVESR